jgi:hypothetical protein
MRFESSELPDQELALHREVREFLAAKLPRGTFEPGFGTDALREKKFSRKLGAQERAAHSRVSRPQGTVNRCLGMAPQ